MSKIYSHSKISTFEQCPKKFEFKYIEKIKPPVEKSIEAHLGSAVHSALEWLYLKIKEKIIPSIDEVIIKYTESWEEDFNENFTINKPAMTSKDYFNKGIEFLVTYYMQNRPFDDNTIEIEKKILLDLDEDKEYRLVGFIDRLAYNLKSREYEIHDYKTANSMPSEEKLQNDRQLALYSLAVKDIYGKEKRVKLIWHFLAHNKKIEIKKTNEELQELKEKTLQEIKEIEKTESFPTNKSILCDWCEYKSICPAWGNSPPKEAKKEEKPSIDKEKYPTLAKYLKD